MGASFGRIVHHPVERETRGPPHDPGSDSEPEITETLATLKLQEQRIMSMPSLSRSPSAGALAEQVDVHEPPGAEPMTMPSNGFALPVLCTNTGAVEFPVFSK